MKKLLKYIIENQSEFMIDSQNFSNEILVDEIINGSKIEINLLKIFLPSYHLLNKGW